MIDQIFASGIIAIVLLIGIGIVSIIERNKQ